MTRAVRQKRLAKLRRRLARNPIGDRIWAAVTRTRGVQGGEPCVDGTWIHLEVVIIKPFMAGDSVTEIADALSLTVENIEDCLRWWHYFGADWRVVPVRKGSTG